MPNLKINNEIFWDYDYSEDKKNLRNSSDKKIGKDKDKRSSSNKSKFRFFNKKEN